MDPATLRHVQFANRLAQWVERAGISDGQAVGDLAVGFADIIEAVRLAGPVLEALLALDPADPADAEQALDRLGYLHALFLTEIRSHLEDLARRWDELEARLLATSPDDESSESAP